MPLDIFSRSSSKEPPKEKVKVIVDFREKNSLVPSELMRLGCNLEFRSLPVGDYICGDFILERKTITDLHMSIVDKRIFSQFDAISSQERQIIMIEGDDSRWKMHSNSFRGIIIWAARRKIPLIMTKDYADTACYILLLARYKPSHPFSMRPYKKVDSRRKIAQYVLEGFPGVGPATASKLLERFGSIKAIFNAPQDELKDALGKKFDSFNNIIS